MKSSELDFELFNRYGDQIRAYFQFPEELRMALPVIEKLKAELNNVPLSFGSGKRVRRSKAATVERKRRSKRSGVRVVWSDPVREGVSMSRKDWIRSRFEAIVNQYGILPEAEVKVLALYVGCTKSAVRAQYQLWSQDSRGRKSVGSARG